MLNRFFEKIFFTDSCWYWAASQDGKGYGQYVLNKKHYRAHRFSYMVFKGDIPNGLDLDHLCREPLCVNPDHLEAVTRSVNLLRGKLWQSKKTECPNGHPYDMIDKRGGRRCRRCYLDNMKLRYLKRKYAQSSRNG